MRAVRASPLLIVNDIRSELTSLAELRRAQHRQIERHSVAPGKAAAGWFYRAL